MPMGVDGLACRAAEAARTFTRLGLVDEYILLVEPVALDTGQRLFTQHTPLTLAEPSPRRAASHASSTTRPGRGPIAVSRAEASTTCVATESNLIFSSCRSSSALHRLTASGLAAIPTSSTWLACVFAVVEAAAALGEPELARQAYELLTPFAHLPIVPLMAVSASAQPNARSGWPR
jgi:hypothetical protein